MKRKFDFVDVDYHAINNGQAGLRLRVAFTAAKGELGSDEQTVWLPIRELNEAELNDPLATALMAKKHSLAAQLLADGGKTGVDCWKCEAAIDAIVKCDERLQIYRMMQRDALPKVETINPIVCNFDRLPVGLSDDELVAELRKRSDRFLELFKQSLARKKQVEDGLIGTEFLEG